MKKLCCYSLGLLLALSFFVPRLAPAQDLLERRGGQNMLFNFNPFSLFFLFPAVAGNFGGDSRIQGQTARIQKRGFQNPFGGNGDAAGGNQQYLRFDPGANSSVANLTSQDFAKNFATNLLTFAQTSPVAARRTESGTAPFFFTAFFQTLGLDTKQLPFSRLFLLQSQFPTINGNTNTFEFTKGIIQFISGGSSREPRSYNTDNNTDTYQPHPNTLININNNTNANSNNANAIFNNDSNIKNDQNDLEQ